MIQFNFKSTLILLTMSAALLASCTKTEEKDTAIDSAVENTILEDSEMNDVAKQDTIKITLNSNDNMQYDLSEIDVYEGQTVVLTLNHTGTMAKESMGHNFVLLKQGTDLTAFGEKAGKAQKDGYIPKDQSDIIANTKLIGGGESDTVTFTAPAKGTYDYLCSFPGHYSVMKGKFNVK